MRYFGLRGFTFLELLCVIAILAIVSFIATKPFFAYQIHYKDRLKLQDDLYLLSQMLLEARQLAITSGVMSYVCGGEACSGEWSSSFELHLRQGLQHVSGLQDTRDTIYRRVILDHNIDIYWKGFPANKSRVEFLSNGLSGYQNGTFWLCFEGWQASVVVNQSGRFYTSNIVDSGAMCG